MNIQAPLDQEGSSRPQLRSWQALVAHKTTISKLKLHNLFKENSRRFEDYSINLMSIPWVTTLEIIQESKG